MNLRDTITEKINYNYCRGAVKQAAKYTTDEILNLFEKRIDSIAKEYQKNDRFMIGFDELKKEMLK